MPKRPKRKNLKPPGKCIFCEGGNLTHEHLWGDWMEKHFPSPYDSTNHTTSFRVADQNGQILHASFAPGKSSRNKAPSRQSPRIVCKCCNSGWMGRLQEAAKPHLTKLMNGNWTEITPDAECLLAAWATMFSMVADFGDPKTQAVTQEERDEFRKTQTPGRNWHVWIGRYSGLKWHGNYWHRGFGFDRVPVPYVDGVSHTCDSQVTTFANRGLMIQTASSTSKFARDILDRYEYPVDFGLRKLHPAPNGVVTPLRVYGDNDFAQIATLMAEAIKRQIFPNTMPTFIP